MALAAFGASSRSAGLALNSGTPRRLSVSALSHPWRSATRGAHPFWRSLILALCVPPHNLALTSLGAQKSRHSAFPGDQPLLRAALGHLRRLAAPVLLGVTSTFGHFRRSATTALFHAWPLQHSFPPAPVIVLTAKVLSRSVAQALGLQRSASHDLWRSAAPSFGYSCASPVQRFDARVLSGFSGAWQLWCSSALIARSRQR